MAKRGSHVFTPLKLARTRSGTRKGVAPPPRCAFRMQPLAEPLLRDAAPEPPAGTARLLLTSHVLTKFGSKAWEVRVTTPARMPIGRYVLQPQPMPALRCLTLSPNQPFLRAVCNAAAAARVQPGRSRCALRLRPLGPPVQGATAAALHAYTRPSLFSPPLSSSSPSAQLLPSTTPGPPRLHPPGPPHTCAHALTGASPPRTLLPVYLRADVRQLDG